MKPVIRNEHREAFKEKRFAEIPEYILTLMKEEEAKNETKQKKPTKKPAEETSQETNEKN